MSKYSNEFKLEVVKYCEEQHHGYAYAAKYFNIISVPYFIYFYFL